MARRTIMVKVEQDIEEQDLGTQRHPAMEISAGPFLWSDSWLASDMVRLLDNCVTFHTSELSRFDRSIGARSTCHQAGRKEGDDHANGRHSE
ncbi:unnamed protein product (mitochondrion) [Plasmodiophora brassicae]|uniref:Uncharacterized protein n=1 Tax=Plasmodiophora brassicae TaxID=37360 RepID=A0A3P3YNU0_PLABS|nr:unnamed protein product [Plasmodiophora brassicae]